MNSNILFKEIKRFFIENIKLIVSVALITLIGFLSFYFISLRNSDIESVDTEEAGESYEIPSHIARFRFYVETSTEQHIGNSNLFQFVLLDEEVVSEVESITSTNIIDWLDWQKENEFVRSVEDPGVIGLTRDGNSETIVFKTRIGTEQESLEIAQTYYSLLENNEIEFFENKEVYLLEEPYLDVPVRQELEASFPRNEINRLLQEEIEVEPARPINTELLVQSVIATFSGFVFGIVIAYFKSKLSKKIKYAFNYDKSKEDLFLLASSKEELTQIISNPKGFNKIILSENMDLIGLVEEETQGNKLRVINNSLNALPDDKLNEIIILIDENNTTKQWYYEQREIIKNYFEGNIKLIQLNANKID